MFYSLTYISDRAEKIIDAALTTESATGQDGYVPIYYPGTIEIRSAVLVDAISGNEIQQLNFLLTRSRAVRVRGRIINPTGKTDRGSNVMRQPKDAFGMMGRYRSYAPGSQGQFEIRAVPPGTYTLIAMAHSA